MQILAPAKINLSLRILGQRSDGYHELHAHAVFGVVFDALQVEALSDASADDAVVCAHPEVDARNNTVRTALTLLRRAVPTLPAHRVHLHKRIPVAAGLGGGSADAAALLRLLQAAYSINPRTVRRVAEAVGADVPVCLASRSAIMQGIGERVTPTPTPAAASMVMCRAPVALSTAEVFAQYQRLSHVEAAPSPFTHNDLLPAARALTPAIDAVLSALQAAVPDAVAVGLSGSGASCFALCDDPRRAAAAAGALRQRLPDCFVAAGPVF